MENQLETARRWNSGVADDRYQEPVEARANASDALTNSSMTWTIHVAKPAQKALQKSPLKAASWVVSDLF